jgi:two-component system, NarL family, sensor kinase
VGLGLQERAVPTRRLTLIGLSWAAAAVAMILAVATAVLAVLGRDLSVFFVPTPLGYAAMGAVLLARRRGHPMGPLLCLVGLSNAIPAFTFAYARYTLVHSPGSLPFATAALWSETWAYAPAASLTGLVLPLVFPDGRLLSPRWRPALWAALAFIPLWFAGMAFIPQSMGGYFHYLPNPYAHASLDRLFDATQILAVGCGLVAAIAAAASVTLRWRRADRAGRQQLKWYLAVLPVHR